MADQLIFIGTVIAMLTVFTVDTVRKVRASTHRK
jgi:hypothetical protein